MKKYTEKYHHRRSPAFTMIELVLVIVVLGILAAVGIPRLERDLKQEAADNVLSAVRYTQHLALIDDKQKFDNPKWQQRWWRIYFGTCDKGIFYAIGSDDNMESANNARVDFSESAIDPANGKQIWAHDGGACGGSAGDDAISPEVLLGKKYGITGYQLSGGCSNSYLGFDHLGRPYGDKFTISTKPDYQGRVTQTCVMTFTLSDGDTFSIKVEPETGYAYIDGQPDS